MSGLEFSGRGIVLDIEGTVAPIAFVHDVLFPYALRHLDAFLDAHEEEPTTREALDLLARDRGFDDLAAWSEASPGIAPRALVRAEVDRLMAADAKATGLEQLQGLIWEAGFTSGELVAPLFPDVAEALRAWDRAGLDVRIYSSGSVAAQRLFFAHTEAGDLRGLLHGHSDTTVGPKREAASYAAIARDMRCPAAELLFVSDVPAELDAAREARFQVTLACRPGNATVSEDTGDARITELRQIRVTRLAPRKPGPSSA